MEDLLMIVVTALACPFCLPCVMVDFDEADED